MSERSIASVIAAIDRVGARIVGVAGAVAVGKTTIAEAIASGVRESGRSAEVVGTDGFLHSNETLSERGILDRKGFPESYDADGLETFLRLARTPGVTELVVPRYSHVVYDVVPGDARTIRRPDVLIVEGVNALNPASKAVPLIDLGVYVDAEEADVTGWFVRRFMHLRALAADDPTSFYRQFVSLDDEEAAALAYAVWEHINGPNLRDHIAPTRRHADVVIRKGPGHEIVAIAATSRQTGGTTG